MATKHTEHYQLNLWEPGDSFLRTEFNENSNKIDAAIKMVADGAGVVAGAYTGTGWSENDAGTQTFDLGFAPKAVVIWTVAGQQDIGSSSLGGMAFPGHPCAIQNDKMFEVTDSGFIAYRAAHLGSNNENTNYYFLAFK